jgi:hypothetical protein
MLPSDRPLRRYATVFTRTVPMIRTLITPPFEPDRGTMSEKPYLQWLTTEESENRLNARELEMSRAHRENILQWMWNQGKNPEAHIGYAETTVKNRSYRLD